jgi:protein MPE1
LTQIFLSKIIIIIMSSTILYKFRSGTTFEALSLPGNNARLLDIKKAIVTAKRLDQGSMDFDLSVKDATSGIEYMDDTAILPRGTRIVVQRLPSARGQGILAKIARSQFGDRAGTGNQTTVAANGPNADFYTIDSRVHDEDEEFVSTSVISPPPPSTDDSELAALRAATDTSMSGGPGRGIGRGGITLRGGPMSSSGGGFRPNQPAGLGPPPSRGLDAFLHAKPNHRPDADPEIREQEHQPQKKRATGIPRTFLSVSAPQGTDGSEGAVIIQPNTFVFEELVTRGGGQSENTAGTKRDLDYALKITATPIPEYLQCAICHNVVRDAMMLPWDPEGRTTCEQCIRTALTENGFRCPLTQQEGVSPDDLLPNHALRKAAVQFVKDVMEKMKEIDQHAETEEDINIENDKQNLIEGDLNDKGVVLTRRAAAAEKRKQDNDDFAGDDDFGGDVFAVEAEKTMDDNVDDPMITETNALDTNTTIETNLENEPLVDNFQQQAGLESEEQTKTEPMEVVVDANIQDSRNVNDAATSSTIIDTQSHRLTTRRRGPPVGYTMGPAIAVVQSPTEPDNDRGQPFDRGSYRGRRGGRMPYNGGRGFRGRYDSHSTASRYIVREENFSNGDAVSNTVALVNSGN